MYGEGDARFVIGDNPEGTGKLILRLPGVGNENLRLTSASEGYADPEGRYIRVPEYTIKKINDRDDWDHEQLGRSEEEIRRNIQRIIRNPDEIWKQPSKDRWMYVKKMVLNGKEVIVTLFVQSGSVETAFTPTHPEIEGEAGYSDEIAKHYIKKQMMRKINEYKRIINSVDEGDTPVYPGDTYPQP